jgi:hypothetical protein
MTSHVGRLYAASVSILVFFLTWLAVAARPWAPQASDPRLAALAALAAREQRVRAETVIVQRIVSDRWATYRRELARLRLQAAAPPAVSAPAVKVVTLPPLTVTRTS